MQRMAIVFMTFVFIASVIFQVRQWDDFQRRHDEILRSKPTSTELTPEEAKELSRQVDREMEKRGLRIPQFTDYNLASAETMDRLSGQWEVIQFWQGKWCKISKDRDRRRMEYNRQVLEINESLMTRIEQRSWDGKRSIKCQDHIAFDASGPGTFVAASYFRHSDSKGEKEWAINNAAYRFSIKNNDRGVYRFDGDRLLLYSVTLSKEGKALPTPTEIPPFPLPEGSELLVLQRIDPQEIYPPNDADLELARKTFLEHEAFRHEHGLDKPIDPDRISQVPQGAESADGFEWLVRDPKDLPEPLRRIYEERYGKP